uniref:Uncharacterized protein n=1 Tax=Anopheles atroparvus TaxID=41427 RepID=A0AAG5DMN3_ANOAO
MTACADRQNFTTNNERAGHSAPAITHLASTLAHAILLPPSAASPREKKNKKSQESAKTINWPGSLAKTHNNHSVAIS